MVDVLQYGFWIYYYIAERKKVSTIYIIYILMVDDSGGLLLCMMSWSCGVYVGARVFIWSGSAKEMKNGFPQQSTNHASIKLM